MTKIVLKGIFDLIISKTHIAYPLSIYADIQQKYAAATKWLQASMSPDHMSPICRVSQKEAEKLKS